MARSKLGGTRRLLQGVVGDVIYQIIRNGQSLPEQKVISYTKEKLNNNTRLQSLARMQIATFEQMMSYLKPIISCSFENVQYGVTSINYFASINAGLIQQNCRNAWFDSWGFFYPSKGFQFTNYQLACAPFQISQGTVAVPRCLTLDDDGFSHYVFKLVIQCGKNPRKIDVRKLLSFSASDSITLIEIRNQDTDFTQVMNAVRYQFNPAFNDYTYITEENVSRLFLASPAERLDVTYEPIGHQIILRQKLGRFLPSGQWIDYERLLGTFIISKKKGAKWKRSSSALMIPPSVQREADDMPGSVEYGRAPFEIFNSWNEEYEDQTYEEFFGKH